MPGREDAIVGCLLGTAIGDAVGLACEGLSRRRQQLLFPNLDGPRLLFRKGMTSDDTEHSALVAQSLIVSGGDWEKFTRAFAWRLRFWLLGLPVVVGLATLRALLKLWLGFPGERSGVFSAGNGPAMRSALLGAAYGGDPGRLRRLVRAATRVTHTDPKAEHGALAVAVAAHLAATRNHASPLDQLAELHSWLGPEAEELLVLLRRAAESALGGEETQAFAAALGLEKGVSGYVYHTVPVALHAWLRHPADFRSAILGAVRCGGDADTVAAIVGGIVGAGVGKQGIPPQWRSSIWEWPRSLAWLEALGRRLAEVAASGEPRPALGLALWAIWPRNLLFLLILLAHGLRRLWPPY